MAREWQANPTTFYGNWFQSGISVTFWGKILVKSPWEGNATKIAAKDLTKTQSDFKNLVISRKPQIKRVKQNKTSANILLGTTTWWSYEINNFFLAFWLFEKCQDKQWQQ